MAKLLSTEKGTALLAVFIIAGISLFILMGALDLFSISLHSTKAKQDRTVQYYEVGRGLHEALGWLRENAANLQPLFARDVFYTKFERVLPSTGSNDTSVFTVPSRLRLKGTNLTPLLVSDVLLGTAAYPDANVNGKMFKAADVFSGSSFKQTMARVTLVDAMPIKKGSDYGDPASGNPAPESDFYPIYRIDVMNDLFQGAHVFGYALASFTSSSDAGFYGLDSLVAQKNCDSYRSDMGPYGGSNRFAGCSVGSNGTIGIGRSNTIYGSAYTNLGILFGGTRGGTVCATFESGCPQKGTICEGPGCTLTSLPQVETWATYYPTDQGDLIVKSNRALVIVQNIPQKQCWRSVTIHTGKSLTLRTTGIPYFFENLSIANKGQLIIEPVSEGTVTLYLRTIFGDQLSGSVIVNKTGLPPRFLLRYLGSNSLRLQGTDSMYTSLSAPLAQVQLSGSFSFFGGIQAKSLLLADGGFVHQDERLSTSISASKFGFELHSTGQIYR